MQSSMELTREAIAQGEEEAQLKKMLGAEVIQPSVSE
jgi:hypothetical protein